MAGDPSIQDVVASLSTSLNRLEISNGSNPKGTAPTSPGIASRNARGGKPSSSPSRRVSGPAPQSLHPDTRGSGLLAATKDEDTTASAPLTAASVASAWFTKELESHNMSDAKADTIVLVHDSCYGHRWSRLKTPKATLGMIVERPERLQAAMRGIAAAYVRLGGRHSGADNEPHPLHEPASTIPFRIRRTSRMLSLTSSAPMNVHGAKWMKELQMMCDSAEGRLAAGQKELGRNEEPGQAPKTKLHDGDLYLCRDSLDALQGALGGVVDGVDAVFSGHKKAFVCIRPPGHHCSSDLPSGFCWINNVHVGIEHAALNHGLTHAAIIDFDLHHGDGSQSITWERNAKASKATRKSLPADRTSIGYFSLHDINSYPCEDGDVEKVQNASICIENAHAQTIWNVHLQPWASLDEFWKHYEERYVVLLEKARHYLRTQTERIRSTQPGVLPKATVFISAGFDASEWESEGMQRHKTNVPTEFYARFTKDMVTLANENDTSVEGRIVGILEGGYSDRALTSGILSHLVGLTSNESPPTKANQPGNPQTQGGLISDWWSAESLTELESSLNPFLNSPSKEARNTEPQAFWSPTRSFSAKVVDPSKLYTSIPGTLTPARVPTPPPPEVNWLVATHELSKLLIPSERQINSCRHEELSEVKAKRERTSNIVPAPSLSLGNDRMQLRGRRSGAETSNVQAAMPPPPRVATSETSQQVPTTTKPAAVSQEPVVAVRKSRRISGPVQDLPGSRRISGSSSTVSAQSQAHAGQADAPNIDSVVAGVKKITLRYNGPKEPETSTAKPVRKIPVPKQPKINPAPKTSSAKQKAAETSEHAAAQKRIFPRPEEGTSAAEMIIPIPRVNAATDTTTLKAPTNLVARVIPPHADGTAVQSTTFPSLPAINQETLSPSPSALETTTIAAIFAPPPPTTNTAPPSSAPTTIPASQKPTPSPLPRAPLTGHTETPQHPHFVPYDPSPSSKEHRKPVPATTSHQTAPGPAPLTWLPPNQPVLAKPPAPKRDVGTSAGSGGEQTHTLPVFTSDGHIPFGSAGPARK